MPIFHQFPYGNTHDQNYDWILKVVKEMLDKYQDIDTHIAEALAQIEAAKNGSLADMQTALENALAEINEAIANIGTAETSALQNINDAKTGALSDIATDKATAQAAIAADKQAAQNAIAADQATAQAAIATDKQAAQNAIATDQATAQAAIATDKQAAQNAIASDQSAALLAIQTLLTSALSSINNEQISATQIIQQLYNTLPADSQSIIGQLGIIMGMLNDNYSTSFPWHQCYYTGTDGIQIINDNTYLSNDETRTNGCANRRMIFSTAPGYHLYELSWWNANPTPPPTELRSVITFPANTTYYDYTFYASAICFSITVRKDDLSVITPQDVAGNINIQVLMNAVNVPSMIAFEEADLTADIAHTVGTPSEYFLYNGALYRALEDIPQYGTIVISGTGANCEETTVCKEIKDTENNLYSTIEEIREYANISPDDASSKGVMLTDGTIDTTFTNVTIYKYTNLRAGKYYLTGTGQLSTGFNFCYVWRVKNGVMVDYIEATSNPQTFDHVEIEIDDNANEIWINTILVKLQKYSAIDSLARNEVVSIESVIEDTTEQIYEQLPPDDISTHGVLLDDGTINTSFSNITICKYTNLAPGTYYLSGGASLDIYYGFCYVWRVKNGSMVDYIAATSIPQTFNYVPIVVDDTANEIWITTTYVKLNAKPWTAVDIIARNKIAETELLNQWKGKRWYAYGTSITANNGTTVTTGKYPAYLAEMSGMILYNKGIGGGGIGDLGAYSTGQVYNAICNTTDGKLNADLITLETGANDVDSNVPLGTVYDTGRTTLCGCLNDCIRYLMENTTAQIVIMNSPYSKTMPTDANQVFKWRELMREICFLNGVYFIDTSCNLGTAKLNSSQGSGYVVDSIHPTDLGGYVFAKNIWYKLRNIPLFYKSIPS